MKKTMFFLMIWLILICSSCKKDPPIEFSYGVPMTFQFKLLDEAGKEATEFKQGQNFTFSLRIKNHSNNKWDLLASRLYQTPDLFRVFKIINSTDSLDMGQPYDTNVWCSEYDIAIKPNETFDLKFNWVSDSTVRFISCGMRGSNKNMLPVGKYKTGFTYRFQFSEKDSFRISLPIRFDINFTIK